MSAYKELKELLAPVLFEGKSFKPFDNLPFFPIKF